MKTCTDLQNNSPQENNDESTKLLFKNPDQDTLRNDLISRKGKNGYTYKDIVQSKSNEDLRNQSLTENKLNGNLLLKRNCDTHDSPPGSPTSESWFKTWPERCEKTKSTDASPEHQIKTRINSDVDTQKKVCDNIENNNKKLTLNEALQNISLAYSPVTKQLHLVDSAANNFNNDQSISESTSVKKQGHRRTEAGSFSSTISTLSDPSTSGSLLDTDDRCLNSFEECETKPRKKSLTQFFTRNVFSWKAGNADLNSTSNATSSVWKLFNRASNEASSPLHSVASSSALIQHKRPSNLPAKTLEEEQKHKDEYNAMIAAAKKKEAKNSAAKQKQQKMQLQLEEQQATAAKHFIQQVLPKWDSMQKTKKTQDIWWHGLPPSVRGKVWRLAIGNELNVTPQLYEICLTRAQNRLNSPEPPQCECDSDQESSMDVIQLDISRTFPNLCIFQQGGPYSDVLHSLLAAYVCFRPDVGYVQGMSYIAAILILNMEPCEAFICFSNLLNQPLHLSAFTLNQIQMQAYYDSYNEVFAYNLPKLHGHFENAGLTPDLYLLDWIYTVFAKAMPLDIACRVWDLFLRDGYEFIFRTALGILYLYQDTLLKMDFLHGAQFLTRLPDEMSSDQLFKSIQSVTTSIGKKSFTQIVEKCSSNLSETLS